MTEYKILSWFFLGLSIVSLILGWGNDRLMWDVLWGTCLTISVLYGVAGRIVDEIRSARR